MKHVRGTVIVGLTVVFPEPSERPEPLGHRLMSEKEKEEKENLPLCSS